MPNSSAVFVDTSGWIAILNADDRLHAQATEQLRRLRRLFQRIVRRTEARFPYVR